MSIFQSAITYTGTVSAITAIVGTRIFGLLIPQGQAVPALTLQLTDNQDQPLLDGVSTARLAYLDVDCWAKSLVAAESLADAVKTAFVGYVGAFGDYQVTNIAKVRELHLFEQDTGYSRVSLQFEILYGET